MDQIEKGLRGMSPADLNKLADDVERFALDQQASRMYRRRPVGQLAGNAGTPRPVDRAALACVVDHTLTA